jgi:putative hydroxymethylpyrimidine transport system substrate-binding protein
MLNQHQLTCDEVRQINVHYDLTQALLSKKVDAVIGVMRTFEVIQMELAKQPARIFYPEEHGLPTYSELIFVIHKNNIHDPRFKKFLIALQKAVHYLKEHPEETWVLFSKNHPELNDELNRRAWFASIPYFTLEPSAFDEQDWLHFAEFMHKNGLIKIIHPIHHYAVDLTKE